MVEDLKNIDQIFWDALQIEGATEREAFLVRACGDDEQLRQMIEKLIKAQPRAERFLEEPFRLGDTAESPTVTEQAGTVIGPYKLLPQIGEGGMGVVFMADGLVLGTYLQFDEFDNSHPVVFYFTIADGLHELGDFVDGGLTANGWDYLASVIRVNRAGQILGHGKLSSQYGGQMTYLLTPAISEPSNVALLPIVTAVILLLRINRPYRASKLVCV